MARYTDKAWPGRAKGECGAKVQLTVTLLAKGASQWVGEGGEVTAHVWLLW